MSLHTEPPTPTAGIDARQMTIADDTASSLGGPICHSDVAIVPPIPETL
jgi:hypothetical protein